MSNLTRAMMMGAAGAASGNPVYVDDVFSTYLYEGNGGSKSINNGIELGSNIGVSLNGKTITDTTGGAADYSKLNNDIFSSANTDYYYGSIDCYIDYGSAVVSTFFDLAPQGDNVIGAVYNTPTSITGYGSNDASSWTSLGAVTFTVSDWAEGKFTRYHFSSNTTAYRYYRLTSSGTTSIQEWRLGISDSSLGKGGMVWLKNRKSNAYDHQLVDTERGKQYNLRTDRDLAQNSGSTGLTSFNNNGFTVGAAGNFNLDDNDHVSWTFRKQKGFFDVIAYNGESNGGTFDTWISIPHNLGSTPGMVFVKCTSHAEPWQVWHRSLPTSVANLNNTTAFSAPNYNTVFGHSSGAADANNIYVRAGQFASGYLGYTYVAYVFAHDDASFGTDGNESIIKCGTYTGNGTVNNATTEQPGPEIDLGFEPQWVMVRSADSADNWWMFDIMRGFSSNVYGPQREIYANEANSEGTNISATYPRLKLKNKGFKITGGAGVYFNYNNEKYIYMAIRRPHKPPTAGTDVYQALNYSGSAGDITRATNFAVDMLHSHRTNGGTPYTIDRRRGGYQYINTAGPNTEGSQGSAIHTFGNNFLDMGNGPIINGSGDTYILEMFRRAPGFFDIVSYPGTSSPDHAVPHNLGVAPDLVFAKPRDWSNNWACYTSTGGVTNNINWSDPGRETTNTAGQYWGPTAFTSTNIYLGSYTNTNYQNYHHIAYLFANLDGICRIGRYDGDTGNNVDVICDFVAGARFVMIKRTDTEISGNTGTNWYYWDSVRGIRGSTDPYMMFNKYEAQVTNTDYIDPLTTGFTVTGSAPASLNATGGTYLYLAIA